MLAQALNLSDYPLGSIPIIYALTSKQSQGMQAHSSKHGSGVVVQSKPHPSPLWLLYIFPLTVD